MMKKIVLIAFIFALAGMFVTCNLDTALRCTVKFENPAAEKGSKKIPDALVVKGTKIGKKLPKIAAREGVVFFGWYDGNNRYDADTIVTEDVTLTARWADDIATVSFVFTQTDNAGNLIVPKAEVADLTAIKGLPLGPLGFPVTPRSEGWGFAGWLLNGEEFTEETPVPGDITLEASWVPKAQFTVTFADDTGSQMPAAMKVYENECIDEWRVRFPPNPTTDIPGGFFVAWMDDESRIYDGRTPITRTLTIKVRWGKPAYKVKLGYSSNASLHGTTPEGNIKTLTGEPMGEQSDGDYGTDPGNGYQPQIIKAWDSTTEKDKWVIVNTVTYDVPYNFNRWRILYRIEFDWPSDFSTAFYTKYTVRARFYANQQGVEGWADDHPGTFVPNKPAKAPGYKEDGWLTRKEYDPAHPADSMAEDGWGQLSWLRVANGQGTQADAGTLLQRYNLDRKGGTINDDWAPLRGELTEKNKPQYLIIQTSDQFVGHIEIYEIVFHNGVVSNDPSLDEWQYTAYIDEEKPSGSQD